MRHLPRRVVGNPPLPEQPLFAQLVNREKGFLERRVVVGGVQVKEVDRFRPVQRRGGFEKAVVCVIIVYL